MNWSGQVVYNTVLVVWGKDSHRFEPQTSTNACRHVCKYMDQKGPTAMLTSIQSAGVTTKVNLLIIQARKHARDLPWLWNPGQTSPEVKNRGISGPTKRNNKKSQYMATNISKIKQIQWSYNDISQWGSSASQQRGHLEHRKHSSYSRQEPPSIVEDLQPRFNIQRICLKGGNLAYILVVLMFGNSKFYNSQ